MKVVVYEMLDSEDCKIHTVEADGVQIAHIHRLSEEPEDAIIERSLIGGDRIARFIQMGYDAAKRGEELEILFKEGEPE
jgi:hypothetical protein